MRSLPCIGIAGALGALLTSPVAIAQDESRTLGFAIDTLQAAVYQTSDAKECPAGFQSSNTENFHAAYTTDEQQQELVGTAGHVQNRGANGENVWAFPKSVKDPLPFKELASKISYGRNLDGTTDGAPTAKTCKHEKFTDPDGVTAVDNQLYRVIGCMSVLRNSGLFVDFMNGELRNRVDGRILMEVSEVDDRQNDPEIIVSFYKGRDVLAQDASNKTIAWQSQTVDERLPLYITHVQGSIVDGVIRTKPANLRLPQNKLNNPGEFRLLDMRVELRLTETGVEGLLLGYHDLEDWFKNHRKPSMVLEGISGQSGPAVYEALYRYADGHKNPTTQQCTSISTAHQIKGTAVFVVHRTTSTKPYVRGQQAAASVSTVGQDGAPQ